MQPYVSKLMLLLSAHPPVSLVEDGSAVNGIVSPANMGILNAGRHRSDAALLAHGSSWSLGLLQYLRGVYSRVPLAHIPSILERDEDTGVAIWRTRDRYVEIEVANDGQICWYAKSVSDHHGFSGDIQPSCADYPDVMLSRVPRSLIDVGCTTS
jgi:hypothetical protein